MISAEVIVPDSILRSRSDADRVAWQLSALPGAGARRVVRENLLRLSRDGRERLRMADRRHAYQVRAPHKSPSRRSRSPRPWSNTKIASRPPTSSPMPRPAKFSPRRIPSRSQSKSRAGSYVSRLRRPSSRKCGVAGDSHGLTFAHRSYHCTRRSSVFAAPNSTWARPCPPARPCTAASCRSGIFRGSRRR